MAAEALFAERLNAAVLKTADAERHS